MAYSFAARLDKLGARKKVLDSNTVTYKRDTFSVSLSAGVSELRSEERFPNTLITTEERRNYFFDANELILNSQIEEPKPGDTVVDGSITCMVLAEDDKACFHYTTQSRKRIRVHTKVITD